MLPRLSLFLYAFFATLALSVPTVDQHILPQVVDSPGASHLSNILSTLYEIFWKPSRTVSTPSEPKHLPQKNVQSKYGDDVVLRFTINDDADAQVFSEAVDTLYLDVWEASKDWADVRVSKTVLESFLTLLPEHMQRSYTPIITHLSQAVYDTYPMNKDHKNARHRPKLENGMPHDLFFDEYQPLSVLYPYMRQLASMFPDRTRLFTIGTSYEGRDIPALRIGIDNDLQENGPRHTVLLTAGSHAREWISTSTAMYLLRSLLHNPGPLHGVIENLLFHYDFIFIPVLNPDGYEYTWTTDRLWRKNRQDTTLPFCRGIDLDRSFPFGWDGDSTVENPCSESYAGEYALQAVEAQKLADWTRNATQSGERIFDAFIDLHSYSQEILYPYSFSCDKTPHNLEDLEELAIGLAKAFRLAYGHYYTVDSACEGSVTLTTPSSVKSSELVRTKVEESGGSALDYFYQDLQVKYAFQIKLRDTGTYGFLLPSSNIVPTGTEAFHAVVGLGRWLLGNRGIEGFTELTHNEIWGDSSDDTSGSPANEDLADTNNEIDNDEDYWWRRRRR